jgi:uncharacterized protein (UPF0371 family)
MIHFLSPAVARPIGHFKWEIYNDNKVSRDLDETLIALAIGAATNSTAKVALMKIQEPGGSRRIQPRRRRGEIKLDSASSAST